MLIAAALALLPALAVGGYSAFQSTQTIRSQTMDLHLIQLRQLADSLDFLTGDVGNVARGLIRSESVDDYLAAASDKRPYLEPAMTAVGDWTFGKPYVYSVFLQDAAGNGVDSRGAANLIPPSRQEEALSNPDDEHWYSDEIYVRNESVRVLAMIRGVRDRNAPNRVLGIVKINVPETSVRELYQGMLQQGDLFYLLDPDTRILSSLEPGERGSPIEPYLQNPIASRRSEGRFSANIGGKSYAAVYRRTEPLAWTLIVAIPGKRMSAADRLIDRATLGALVFGSALCAALVRLRFRERSALKSRVREAERQLKEAQLKALEEQINPHFLYNTLDLIYWMSRMEKAFETSVMIGALSRLFRIGLNRGSRFTTVAKEVELIRDYMLIQQKRYEEAIRFSIEAEPDTLDCKVVKMVLQPIVENAIVHGLEPAGGEGRIDVRIVRDPVNGDLVYRIWDDGVGADAETVRRMLESHNQEERQGMGLRNVHDRIRLYYGSAYGIDIASDETGGTSVIVRQPFEKG